MSENIENIIYIAIGLLGAYIVGGIQGLGVGLIIFSFTRIVFHS